MDETPPLPTPNRRSAFGSACRLEGLAVQKRLGHVEMTRYLVLDFNAGSLAVHRTPPPADLTASGTRRRRNPLRLRAHCRAADLTAANLAHVSRQPRNLAFGVWDPKFTAPANVDWKIR